MRSEVAVHCGFNTPKTLTALVAEAMDVETRVKDRGVSTTKPAERNHRVKKSKKLPYWKEECSNFQWRPHLNYLSKNRQEHLTKKLWQIHSHCSSKEVLPYDQRGIYKSEEYTRRVAGDYLGFLLGFLGNEGRDVLRIRGASVRFCSFALFTKLPCKNSNWASIGDTQLAYFSRGMEAIQPKQRLV